jgi:hypothetical protein
MRAAGVKIVIMRRFFFFWWLCARTAFRGNAAFANDWQWLIGYPITAASLWILGYFYAELSGKIEVTLSTGALGALAAAIVAYIITWGASFIVRLFNAPVIQFHEQKDRADKLEAKPAKLIDMERSCLFLDPPKYESWKAKMVFACSGGPLRICVEFSAISGGIGPGKWSQPRMLPLQSISGFAKGQEVTVELMFLDHSQPTRFWRWAIEGADGNDNLVYPAMNRCRLIFMPTNEESDFFNFIVLDSNSAKATLVGEHLFNYVKDWNR